MNDVLLILIAMLAVFGFYCVLAEIRSFFRFLSEKRNTCAKNIRLPFDKRR